MRNLRADPGVIVEFIIELERLVKFKCTPQISTVALMPCPYGKAGYGDQMGNEFPIVIQTRVAQHAFFEIHCYTCYWPQIVKERITAPLGGEIDGRSVIAIK